MPIKWFWDQTEERIQGIGIRIFFGFEVDRLKSFVSWNLIGKGPFNYYLESYKGPFNYYVTHFWPIFTPPLVTKCHTMTDPLHL